MHTEKAKCQETLNRHTDSAVDRRLPAGLHILCCACGGAQGIRRIEREKGYVE